jgi:putative transposase
MPYGLKRFQKAEALHFITFSCFHRLPFLEAPATKETFEFVLEQTRSRHQARVYAYVLMPEHVHLLINEPPLILVAQFLKALKQITSRKLRGDRPQFWQDRYFDANIRGESALSEVIRYIHRNPRGPQRQVDVAGVEVGQKRTGRIARAVPMEQLQPLRHGNSRNR